MKQKLQRKCAIFLLALVGLTGYTQNANPQKTVTGIVTDAVGMPLPGVNVFIKNTNRGTQTDFDGEYTISASPGETIVFSFIGMNKIERTIGEDNTYDVVLEQDSSELSEVVIVGYGTQAREDVTGSVTAVEMDNIQRQPLTGADQALSGQIAGVQVQQSNGAPGGGPKITIRGVGSLSASTDPLYVVDGFALPTSSSQVTNPLNTIPPQSIESITVLKDASATAIYGSRGANGVILIETKEGRKGPARIEINAYTGVQQPIASMLPDLLNAEEFAAFRKEYFEGMVRYNEGREPTEDDVPEDYRNPQMLGQGTNWLDEILQIAPMNNLSVTVSGGSDDITTSFSAGYTQQEGVVLGSGYERYFLSGNMDAKLGERVKIGFNFSPTYTDRPMVASGGNGRYEDGYGAALVASPLGDMYREDGSLTSMIQSAGTFNYPNPVFVLENVQNSQKSLRTLAGTYLEFEFMEGLFARTTLNLDLFDERVDVFYPSTVGTLNGPPPRVPWGSYGRRGYLNWQSETTLNFRRISGDHSYDMILGNTVQQNLDNSATFYANDFPDDDITTFNASPNITGSTDFQEWKLLSFFGRVNYSYKDRYLMTGTLRTDGTSRFGANNRWGLFPSMALGWNIANESFMSQSFFDDLKLRGSYGVTGNFNIDNYGYTGEVIDDNYIIGQQLAPGKILNTMSNSNLGWETTKEYNIGLDFQVLDGRLGWQLDVYQRTTEDMLLDVEIPNSSGFSTILENRGKIRNRGVELALSSTNIAKDDFSWRTDLNISRNINKTLELGPNGAPIYSGGLNGGARTNVTRIGQPVALFYGWNMLGVYESENDIENSTSYPGAIPGNIKPEDVNGDGQLTRDGDFTVIGNPYPDFQFGLTNSLNFQNFDLQVLITGSVGGEIMRASNEYLWNIDGPFNVDQGWYDNRWQSPAQPGDGNMPTAIGPSRARNIFRDPNSLWIHDNSHLWIKNINLSYNMPQGFLGFDKQVGQIYFSVQNAFLFSKYKGGNPESSNYRGRGGSSANLTPGYDLNSYPVSRTYTLGLRLSL